MESTQESSSTRWWSGDTIVLVTGSNKGLGLQIVQDFAKRGLTTVLTSRDVASGTMAVARLKEEKGLDVVYHQLDVTNPSSVDCLTNWLSETYGKIDILVNNAGVTSYPFTLKGAKLVLETNYYGVKRMIEAITPIMKPGGRIVNISSVAGNLNKIKNEWRATLEAISNLTVDTIEQCLRAYLKAAEMCQLQAKGWPSQGFTTDYNEGSDYCISKAAMNAYARLAAQELQAKQISVNCMCPGLTNTSMTNHLGHSAKMGADTAIWLALLPSSQPMPTGKFFINRTEVGLCKMPLFFNGRFLTEEEVMQAVRMLDENIHK